MPAPHTITIMQAAFIGIDWGTTHRRASLIGTDGTLLSERVDGEGALACAGRFRASLEALTGGWPQADAGLPVVMAGMVGSAIGWQAVPYLQGETPLSDLARHLVRVAEAPADRRWRIVPGYCLRGASDVDVMRGEETQLYGALQLLGAGASDGCYVLPGTHSKWVRLHGGRITELRTYMTGELFALLRQHGTLASAMQTAGSNAAAGLQHANVADDPEFLRGVAAAAAGPALTHALFGARARVVTGALAPDAAAAYVSGLLIGAEWADAQRLESRAEPVRLIGEPALASLHAACARHHGRRLETLDARQIQLAAWRALATEDIP